MQNFAHLLSILSTCGNARFQLIKLCKKENKNRKITLKPVKNSQSTSISNVKELQELYSMEINVFNAILCVSIFPRFYTFRSRFLGDVIKFYT